MVVTKHIAVICNYKLLPERVGGMDHFFWLFNTTAIKNGVTIDWFFPNTSHHGDYSKFNIIATSGSVFERAVINSNEIQQSKYSHIITHFIELCTAFYADLNKLQPQAKLIAVDHNPRPLEGYSRLKKLKKTIKGIVYSKHIDQFIGVSEYTSNEILKDFGKFLKSKTKTIYNGVLIKDILTKLNERRLENPKFIVVSHLRFSKGIQDLIKAVHNLTEDLKANLCIDLYGEGPYEDDLRSLVALYNLTSVFNFKGSSSILNALYCNYDYLLQPTHMECFSLSILESLAANIPVVTTAVGGNEEVVFNNENGFIFEAKHIDQFTELLEKIIKGEKNIVTNTRGLIEHKFSIEAMVKNHLELLK